MTRRNVLQALSFIVFAILLSGVSYRVVSYAVAISPLVGLADLINGHPWTWKLFLAMPLAALAFFNGRCFCFYLCPTGTILEHVPLGRKRGLSPSAVPTIILVVTLGSSFFTLAVLLLVDPLSIFAGAVNVFQFSFNPVDLWLVCPILVLIGINLIGRRYWCYRLCPLGALLRLMAKAGHALSRSKRRSFSGGGLSRRSFVTSLAGGLALGWVGSRSVWGRSRRLIRPPGALPGNLLNRKCVRCGNCMKACVTDGILPCFSEAGWDGVFTPRLVPSVGYCDQYCVACMHSCPSGALRTLSLAEKWEERLGLARVKKERCLAWTYNKYCLVCQEYCPYNAIDTHRKDNGIPCPVVNPAQCRGCGQCEYQCKTKINAAIQVYSL